MYIDGLYYTVRKVDTSGIITAFAGTGVSGYSGNGGAATSAKLADPVGIAVDSSGIPRNMHLLHIDNIHVLFP